MLSQSTLALSIQDPGGHIRRIPLTGREALWLGRDPQAPAHLRDSTLPQRAGELRFEDDHTVWMKAAEGAPAFRLGDLETREAKLIRDLEIRWGESELRLVEQAVETQHLPPIPAGVKPWLTTSPSGRKLLWDSRKAARTPLSIYIEGETGSGKEVMAQLIHSWSDRAAGAFIPLNCAALNLSLVESELFGHTKGAFTGAHQHRSGALMQAHNGTLFLDEIGDLPLDIQVKLLRFLENGEIRPVGSDVLGKASIRLICATHKPLAVLVASGKFRRDLYYRLASVTLQIPALRDRLDDIELLARAFALEFGKTLSPQAILRLKAYSWPGNVRELRHTLERACAMTGEFSTVVSHETLDFLSQAALSTACQNPADSGAYSSYPALRLREIERHVLLQALRIAHGNRSEAARILGVARSTVFEMLKRHRLRQIH